MHIITDNAANVKVVMTKVLQNVQWRPCFAHTLQLSINMALDCKDVSALGKMLAEARTIASHYWCSPSAMTALMKIQLENSMPQHKLIQDVVTRWNSQVLMLECLLEQRKVITLALSQATGSTVPSNLI